MSNGITISLTTKRREDAEKMAARAAELVKEKDCDLEFELFDADDAVVPALGYQSCMEKPAASSSVLSKVW